MAPGELRAACLTHPGSEETFPFPRYPNRSVFRVGGKVFAISSLAEQPLRVSLKCHPDLAVQLRQDHPAIQPGARLNRKHWNTVILDDSLPERLILDLIEDSYDLVLDSLPQAARTALRSEPEQPI